MFGFGGKKQIAVADEGLAKAFEETNKVSQQCVRSIESITKIREQFERDMVIIEQTIIDITTAINNIDARVAALEEQLSVRGIKFSNN